MRISHTYFPDGHRINWWEKVQFGDQFIVDKQGYVWFSWWRILRNKR